MTIRKLQILAGFLALSSVCHSYAGNYVTTMQCDLVRIYENVKISTPGPKDFKYRKETDGISITAIATQPVVINIGNVEYKFNGGFAIGLNKRLSDPFKALLQAQKDGFDLSTPFDACSLSGYCLAVHWTINPQFGVVPTYLKDPNKVLCYFAAPKN